MNLVVVTIVVVILVLLLVAALVVLAARRNRRRALLRSGSAPSTTSPSVAAGIGAPSSSGWPSSRSGATPCRSATWPRGARALRAALGRGAARVRRRPGQAVADADGLINGVLRSRGYPVENFDDRAALVATDHQDVVERYREAHDTYAEHLETGSAETERLRQAFLSYREVFDG